MYPEILYPEIKKLLFKKEKSTANFLTMGLQSVKIRKVKQRRTLLPVSAAAERVHEILA